MIDSVNALPKYSFDKITDISPEFFNKIDVKAIGIDLDNTSVYDCTFQIIDGVMDWLKSVKDSGIQVFIISNTYKFRTKIIANKMNCHFYAKAEKPDKTSFIEAAKKANVDIENFAMIGDRLFTDILGANNVGAVSIRVKPYQKEKLLSFYWKSARKKEKEFFKSQNYQYDNDSYYYSPAVG